MRREGLFQKCIKLRICHQDIHHLPAIKPATGGKKINEETATERPNKSTLQLYTTFPIITGEVGILLIRKAIPTQLKIRFIKE